MVIASLDNEQLERNRRLLALKGVSIEDEEPEPKVDSGLILEQYRQKKVTQQNPDKWDDLDLKWNPDGTLSHLTAYRDGTVLYEMDFAWNPDGSLNKVMRS
jgi:hypothetical protein